MQGIRTNGSSPFSVLRVVAQTLDSCWWYLEGNGFSITKEFSARAGGRTQTTALREHWSQLLADLVDHHTPAGRVGRPGFFSQLGDSVDFSWTCLFAVESTEMPMPTLLGLKNFDRNLFESFPAISPDIILAARDIDSAYQEYGFRDEWLFEAVLDDLRRRGLPVNEISM